MSVTDATIVWRLTKLSANKRKNLEDSWAVLGITGEGSSWYFVFSFYNIHLRVWRQDIYITQIHAQLDRR